MLSSNVVFVFILCVLEDFYVLKKILHKNELNVFDVLAVFYTVYFILIPIKCVLSEVNYWHTPVVSEVNQTLIPPLLILLFKSVLLLFDIIVTRKRDTHRYLAFSPSFWNLTEFICFWHKYAIVTRMHFGAIVVILIFSIYPLLTQGDASIAENGQRVKVYSNFFEGLWGSVVAWSFPTAILLNFKFLFDFPQDRKIGCVVFVVGLIVAAMGSRTMFLYILIAIGLFIYSVKRDFFTPKTVLCFLLLLFFVVSLLFPLLGGFRSLRNAYDNKTISVSMALNQIVDGKSLENYSLLRDKDGARSFNLYHALYESVTVHYQSPNGALVVDQLKTLVPFYKPDSKYEEIYSKTLEGGGDIGESVLMCYFFDMGVWGVLIGPLYYVVYFFILSLFVKIIHFFVDSPLLNFLLIFTVLKMCCNIEIMPNFRSLWNPVVVVFIVYSVMFKSYEVRKKIC